MKDASHSARGSESTRRFILQKICEEMELDPGRVKPLESTRGDFRWEDDLGKSETVKLGHARPLDNSGEAPAEAPQKAPAESDACGPAGVAADDVEDEVPLPEPSCRAGPAPLSDDPACNDPETVNSKRAKAKKQIARAFGSAHRSAAPSPADAKGAPPSANAPSAGGSVASPAGKTATSPGAARSRSSDTLVSRNGRLDQTLLSPDHAASTSESTSDIEITEEKRRDFAWRSEYLLNVIREVESMDADDDTMSATAIRRRVRSAIKLTLFALSLAASGTLAVLALGLYLL